MTLIRLLFALVLILPAPIAAQTPAAAPAPAVRQTPVAAATLAGTWALRVEGTIMLRFDLEADGAGWRGSWTKPRSFFTDGAQFGNLTGPPVEQKAQGGRAIGEWAELTFGDQRLGAVPDIFRFRLISPDRAEMIYAETGLAPFELVRVPAGAALGPWTLGRVYRREGVRPGPRVSFSAPPTVVAPGPAPADDERPEAPAVQGR